MKKTFAGITTIAILLVLTGFMFNSFAPVKRAAADTETEWELNVTGLVENPLSLNWTEILGMPETIVSAALVCVDFPNQVLMEGNWTGVKLGTLIEEAKPLSSVIKVAFYAADGYSTDLSITAANRSNVIIAYEINGTALNGLRLVVPGKWGYKWISQITVIELLDYNYLGKWESLGYSDEADLSSGESTIRDLKSSPKVDNSSPPPTTPSPSTSPPPSPSPPSDQYTPSPEPSKGTSLLTETVYAMAVSVAVIVLVAALTFVWKKNKMS